MTMLVQDKSGTVETIHRMYSPTTPQYRDFSNPKKPILPLACKRAGDVAFQLDMNIYIATGFRSPAVAEDWVKLRDHISGCDHCRARAQAYTGSA